MAIVGQSKLDAASITFETLYQENFGPGQMPRTAGLISKEIPVQSKTLKTTHAGGYPKVRKWRGDKLFKDLRAFDQEITVEPYEASIEMNALDVDGDRTGNTQRVLSDFLASEANAVEQIVWDAILTNPIGYDGVSILNDTHPYSNSTGDNKFTDGFSITLYNTMREQMMAIQDEQGRSRNVTPNTLFVGSALETEALEATGADQVIYFDNTGAEATSGVVGAVTRPNPNKGTANVVVVPPFTGTQYLLADLTKPVRPFVTLIFEAFNPQTQLKKDDEARFLRNKYRYSLEGIYGIGAGAWWLVAGKLTA